MKYTLLLLALLCSSAASASTTSLEVVSEEGAPLPGALVNLARVTLGPDFDCTVVQQAIVDEEGRARISFEEPGVYVISVELASFIGTEIGPFRFEGPPDQGSEGPKHLTVVLHDACLFCVDEPATNGYFFTERCGASYPAH